MDRFNKAFICIGFTDNAIMIACLRQDFSGISLLSSATFPLRDDDETISDISKFVSSYVGNSGKAYVTIPPEWSIIKLADLPLPAGGGKNTIANMMRFEIERHMPYRIEDISYDFQILDRGETASKVIFASVQRERIDFVNGILKRLSLKPQIIIPSPLAVLNSIELNEAATGSWRNFLGIHKKADIWSAKNSISMSVFIDDNKVHAAVIKKGSLMYLRSFISSNPLNSLLDVISSMPEHLLGEKINKIILSGSIVSMSSLSAALKEKVGVEVRVVNPVSKVSNLKNDSEAQKIALLLGAFYARTGLGSFRINLLPMKAEGVGRKSGAWVFTLFLFSIFLLIIGSFAGQLRNDKKVLTQLSEKLKENEPVIKKIEEVSSSINALEIQRTFLSNESKNIVLLDVLLELSNIIPLDAWITEFDYKEILEDNKKTSRKELIISGQATSSSSLISILENSPFFEKVEFVGPVTKAVGKEKFKIKALIVREGRIHDKKT